MTADLTSRTEHQAGIAEQLRPLDYDDRTTDYDIDPPAIHDPCTKPGCLVCDVFPRVWAEHVAEQNAEWWS